LTVEDIKWDTVSESATMFRGNIVADFDAGGRLALGRFTNAIATAALRCKTVFVSA
jgi:hypothetical protein